MKPIKVVTSDGTIKWEVRVRTDGRGSKRLRRRFDKKIDADDFLSGMSVQKKELKDSGLGAKPFEDTTFSAEAAEWLAHGEMHFRPSHLRRVKGILEELLPRIGSLTPNQITPKFLGKLQRELKTTTFVKTDLSKKRKVPLKPVSSKRKKKDKVIVPKLPANATVNLKTEVITSVLNFSAKEKRIPFNPVAGFSKLPDDAGEMLFWEGAETASFLKFANAKYPPGSEKRWIYIVYLTTLNCCLRAAEVWGLQPRDITDKQTLFVRRQWIAVIKDFGLLKSKDGRDSFRHVPCNRIVRAELESWIERQGIAPSETIFQTNQGNPIDHNNFYKRIFERDLREWGGKKIRFHDLRHTGTTLLIGAGVDLKTVKEICGHENIETTMRYAHLLGGMVTQVAQTFSILPAQASHDPEPREPISREATGLKLVESLG